MKRPKNTIKKIKPWRKYCDWLWSRLIKARAGYKSELSGTVLRADGRSGQLHSHHLIDSKVLCYRYEPKNGICLSAQEHKLDKHRAAHRNPRVFDAKLFGLIHAVFYGQPQAPQWIIDRHQWFAEHYRTGPEQDLLKPKLKDYPGIADGLEQEIEACCRGRG